jgi:hypothetical protein
MRAGWLRLAAGAASLVLLWPVAADAAAGGIMVARWGFSVRNGVVRDLTTPRNDLTLHGNWVRALGRDGSEAVWFRKGSIARTPSRRALNPGRARFAFGLAFRFPAGTAALAGTDSPNLVQKGLFGSGRQWKLEVLHYTGGRIQCRMIGGRRSVDVVSPVRDVVADRAWHRAACLRTDHSVVLVVDGVRTVRSVRVGSIRNDDPVTVGNKYRSATTDQFRGLVDSMAVARGQAALRRVLRAIR